MNNVSSDLRGAPQAGRLYISGPYPESPSHIFDADGDGGSLCGSRVTVYARRHAEPQRRLCAKCTKKAMVQTLDVSLAP